jgi:phosphoglycerol transferase MdoB-like AlkP superfamily enzyme
MYLTLQTLLKRFGIAFLTASICRLLFLVFNPILFSFPISQLAESFFFGMAYDISALVYLHGIFIGLHLLPNKLFKQVSTQNFIFFLFLLGQFLFIFFNLIDVGLFPILGRRSGSEIMAMATETEGLVFQYLFGYWYLFVCLVILFYLNYFVYKKIVIQVNTLELKTDSWPMAVLFRVSVLILVFIGGRGGLKLMPLNPFDAARNTRAELIPLVINTPFNMIISVQHAQLKPKKYFENEELLLSNFNPIKQVPHLSSDTLKRNIVLIIVESLGKEYVGFYNYGKGYTPFLDSIMQHSEVFMHAYANGKKSIEGIPAVLSGMPSLMQVPYLSSNYHSNLLRSAGYYLQEIGYTAGFYHGGKNGTMSFDNYIALSNGGEYFGKNEYPNNEDFDGFWGISDRPYLQYVAKQIGNGVGPTFATVFTLTSHHPYQLPNAEVSKFKEGALPIHKTISYTDDALRDFFETAAKQHWYQNTTFIITADHSAENQYKYYQTPQGKFEIPLFIYRPDKVLPKKRIETVSQTDILQLILEEANYSKPFFSFGSGLSNDSSACAMQFHDGYHQIIQWPFVLNFANDQAIGLFQLEKDSLMKVNQIDNVIFQSKKESLTKRAKAIIQTFNTHVINNTTH